MKVANGPTRILVMDENGNDLPFEIETADSEMLVTVDTEEIRSEAFEQGLYEGARERGMRDE